MKILIAVLTLILAASAGAQLTNELGKFCPGTRTYFDAFNATPDVLLVRGTSTIGTVAATYPVEIRAERLTNPQTTNSVYAVSFRTTIDQQRLIDYVDYDELDALIRTVPLISQANATLTPMDNLEAVIRTRDGMSIAKIVKGNRTVIAITAGYANAPHNEMPAYVLDDLGKFLVAAKAKLDMVIASGQ